MTVTSIILSRASHTVHIPELGRSGVFAYQNINGKRVLCFALGLASINGKKITSSTASIDPVYTAGVNYMKQNGTDEAYCLAQAYVWAMKSGKSFSRTYAQMMYSFNNPPKTYDEIKALDLETHPYFRRAALVIVILQHVQEVRFISTAPKSCESAGRRN